MLLSDRGINMYKKLEDFAKLKDGWNGYEAKAYDKKFLEKVDVFLNKLNNEPDMFPVPNGNIQLEYETKHHYLEITLYPDGNMGIYEEINQKTKQDKLYDKYDYELVNKLQGSMQK